MTSIEPDISALRRQHQPDRLAKIGSLADVETCKSTWDFTKSPGRPNPDRL